MTPFRMQPSLGGFYVSAAAETTIAVAGTLVKSAGTTTAFPLSGDITMPTDNRLRYDGATTRNFKIDISAEMSVASGTNQQLSVQIYKYDASAASGSLVTGIKSATEAAATAAVQVSVTGVVELDTGDYIEVWVGNETGTPNVTADLMAVTMIGCDK